jgi:hypothetical protein
LKSRQNLFSVDTHEYLSSFELGSQEDLSVSDCRSSRQCILVRRRRSGRCRTRTCDFSRVKVLRTLSPDDARRRHST